jgi:GMP synthase-like glutamine amidotransferase
VGTVCALQDAVSEPPGAIVDALRAAGHTLEIVKTFEGEPAPVDPGGAGGLIAMGGPMGVCLSAKRPNVGIQWSVGVVRLHRAGPLLLEDIQ